MPASTRHVNFNTVPWVIYTHPEIAWVGQTEQATEGGEGRAVQGRAPSRSWRTAGHARLGDTTGHGQVDLADATTDEILGVHMVGPHGLSELISEAVDGDGIQGLVSEDIGAHLPRAPFAQSEATKEAALAVDKRTLNF